MNTFTMTTHPFHFKPLGLPALRHIALALAVSAGLASPGAQAADFTRSGSLVYNTDVVQIDFTVSTSGAVRLWTDSWQAGLNFDPVLGLFSATGALLQVGDDTSDPAALLPGQGGYDSQLLLPALAAGQYRLTLSASSNDPLGPTLADGFLLAGTVPVLISEWNQPSYDINKNDQKGGAWQVHLDGVDAVSVVPEPASQALLLAGLLAGVAVVAARRRA